eukprot:605962-Amphidinium_carterae.2
MPAFADSQNDMTPCNEQISRKCCGRLLVSRPSKVAYPEEWYWSLRKVTHQDECTKRLANLQRPYEQSKQSKRTTELEPCHAIWYIAPTPHTPHAVGWNASFFCNGELGVNPVATGMNSNQYAGRTQTNHSK